MIPCVSQAPRRSQKPLTFSALSRALPASSIISRNWQPGPISYPRRELANGKLEFFVGNKLHFEPQNLTEGMAMSEIAAYKANCQYDHGEYRIDG